MIDEKDVALINETVEESVPVDKGNITQQHSLTIEKPRTTALAQPVGGVPINGFGELPASIIALPYVVLVQNGTNVFLADGKTPAPKGTFYFVDIQETTPELHFVPLRALIRKKMEERDGKVKEKTELLCLCANMEDFDLFILKLPISSFTAWGRMIAQMKKKGIVNSYEQEVVGTVESTVNKDKQQFYVGHFSLGSELGNDDIERMEDLINQYAPVMDRPIVEEEEVGEVIH